MDIKIDKNRIQLADISAFTNRTLYVVPDSKDSVTFIFSENLRQTLIVNETTVNGIQMTATNIDELLVDLFFLDNSQIEALDIEIKRIENKLDTIVGIDDPNGIIDRWDEIVQFLNGIEEDETLLSILLDQKQKLRTEGSELFSLSASSCMNLIKAGYDVLVADTAMLSTDRSNLSSAYTSYKIEVDTLITTIANTTNKGKTTDIELNLLKIAANDYSSAVLAYKTVEEQIRQNIFKTKASIIHRDINLLINSAIIKETYVSYETGEFLFAPAHDATNYLDVSIYNQITISNTLNKPFSNARIGFYDQNKVFLSGYFLGASYSNKGTVDIPQNASCLVFSYDVKMQGGIPFSTVMIQSGNVATNKNFTPEDIQNQIQKIENLMAAGRNIMTNTTSVTVQNIVGQGANRTITTNMIQGKTYTLSYESTTLVVANNYPQFYIWPLNDWNNLQSLGSVEEKTRTFVWNKPTGAYTFTVYNHNYPQSGTITKLKLERGSTATNWTPAPEDL